MLRRKPSVTNATCETCTRLLGLIEKERAAHREEVKHLVSRIGVSQYQTPHPTYTKPPQLETSEKRIYDSEGLDFAVVEDE